MTGVSDLVFAAESVGVRSKWLRLCALVRRFLRRVQGRPPPPVRFVVLSYQRCGTNLLCGRLHNHPDIIMHNELFNELAPYSPVWTSGAFGPWNVYERDRNPQGFLDAVLCPKDERTLQRAVAVGFKSFPEHWHGRARTTVFRRFIEDPEVRVIVLCRRDPLATLVSKLRARETTQYVGHGARYDHVMVQVTPASLQKHADELNGVFEEYRRLAATKLELTYTDLTLDPAGTAQRLCAFLGVEHHPLPVADHTTRQSTGAPTDAITTHQRDVLEFAFRHTELAVYVSSTRGGAAARGEAGRGEDQAEGRGLAIHTDTPGTKTWNIILPICSRGHRDDEENAWSGLEAFAQSVVRTTSVAERELLTFTVGIDEGDAAYDSHAAQVRIRTLLPGAVVFDKFDARLAGKVCVMWNNLAHKCPDADLFVLLGDDVTLLDPGWKTRIEARFNAVAASTGLQYGDACIAFHDASDGLPPGYPTFPVVHRRHLERFGYIVPSNFVNQGGDPFLFELYRQFGAAEFETVARLRNGVGGFGEPRYHRNAINWQGRVLGTALRTMEASMEKRRLVSIDVVIPTFRCEVTTLEALVALRATVPAAVRFWIIVDNPEHPAVEQVRALATPWAPNYRVHVIVVARNGGASAARNRGLDETTATYVLFLDDDVVPDAAILDAYIGATLRHPAADVFVGATQLPNPVGLWTHAVTATQLAYFYNVASHTRRPPWGVTANLCVRRVLPGGVHLRFDTAFPRTGGGEDVDFCWQHSATSGKAPVAVPGARVAHPWWNGGRPCLGHIVGWTAGETLLPDLWPDKTFRVCPTWCEGLLVVIVVALALAPWWAAVQAAGAVVAAEVVFSTFAYYEHTRTSLGVPYRLGASTLGALITAAQQAARMGQHLRRGRVHNLCRRVDWFDGHRPAWCVKNRREAMVRLAVHAVLTALIIRRHVAFSRHA